jgi:hypothetical protein
MMAKTGPRTRAGKAVVRQNAVTHGLRSSSPVIAGRERQRDWEQHRAGLASDLAPVGALEEQLVELVAGLLWRLRRVPGYEADQIAVSVERIDDTDLSAPGRPPASELSYRVRSSQRAREVLTRLAELPDNAPLADADAESVLLAVAGDDVSSLPAVVPGTSPPLSPEHFTGWDAGVLRECLEAISENLGAHPAELISWALARAADQLDRARVGLDETLRYADRMRRDRALPDARILERVTRYEAHLYRRLFQALHEIEALQARRRGEPVPLARLQVHGLPGA